MSYWTQEEALVFVRNLERVIAPFYHVALAGSVLHRGGSKNDLDILIFPHHAQKQDLPMLRELLGRFGMELLATVEEVHAVWRDKGSTDTKHVEVYRTSKGKRVDVFLPWAL